MSVRIELCKRIAETMASVNLSAYTIGLTMFDVELNDAELHIISTYTNGDIS